MSFTELDIASQVNSNTRITGLQYNLTAYECPYWYMSVCSILLSNSFWDVESTVGLDREQMD